MINKVKQTKPALDIGTFRNKSLMKNLVKIKTTPKNDATSTDTQASSSTAVDNKPASTVTKTDQNNTEKTAKKNALSLLSSYSSDSDSDNTSE